MKKIGTRLLGIVQTIFLLPVGVIVLLISMVTKPRVRKPRPDVPFTYDVGLWPYQDQLIITHLEAHVLDSRLTINNGTSLIEIIIEGTLSGQQLEGQPFITSTHLVKQIIRSGYDTALAEYHITPIIDVRTNHTYTGEPMTFRLKQELHCQSIEWGKNTFHFVCKDHTDEVVVFQDK